MAMLVGSRLRQIGIEAEMVLLDTGTMIADVHTPGQGALLREVEQRGLTNVRVGDGDAADGRR